MEQKQSLRGRISDLKKGEYLTVSLREYTPGTIRGYASELGFFQGKRFSTKRNNIEMTCTIIRYE